MTTGPDADAEPPVDAAPEPAGDPAGPPRDRFPPHLAAASGLLMGAADAVPGVSGGTIALIIGIYDRFIQSLSTVVKAPARIATARGRAELMAALGLLAPLGAGILVSYYLVTKLLVGPEDAPGVLLRLDTAPICYAFFFGLVLVSLREPWRRIVTPGAAHIALAVAGCVAAALFVGLPHREAAAEPALWALCLGGAGAIAVMLLPGVSGSLLLVILGQYTVVAGAVHDRDVTVLAVFALGLVLGVVSFVPLLRFLLRHHHDLTMAALTGLMAGSLRALWPYKTNYSPKLGPMVNTGLPADAGSIALAAGALVAGGAVVWLLARLERRILVATGQPLPADDPPAQDRDAGATT